MRPSARSLLPLLLTAAGALASASAAFAAPPARQALRGSHPNWATAARDRGRTPDAKVLTVRAYLPLRNANAAAALARAVSDPSSAQYHQFLSPSDFRARFAPTASDVSAVKAFLSNAGLTIVDVPANNHYVEASGTVAKAKAAFGVDIHSYAYRAKLLDAPTGPVTVPTALGGRIVAVKGLDESGALTRPASVERAAPGSPQDGGSAPAAADAPTAQTDPPGQPIPGPPPAHADAPPCSSSYGQKPATGLPPAYGRTVPYAPCGYVPGQFQSAYGLKSAVASGVDGRGKTVAIVDAYAAPTILQDANTYASKHGEAPFASGQFSQIFPSKGYRHFGDCDPQGWYGEETLDVEAVHAMAPGAKVLYAGARSCFDEDLLDRVNTIVDGRLADVISNSYGGLGEDIPSILAADPVYLQAAIEGITTIFSTGDSGDDSEFTEDGSPLANYPATDPFVTAAGGTSLGIGAAGQRLFETGWATGLSGLRGDPLRWDPAPPGRFFFGGGGGTSEVIPQPPYQSGVVPPAISQGARTIPDISLDGDPTTGMLLGETQEFPDGSTKYGEFTLGGTSLAAPLLAGLAAVSGQAAGHPLGLLNFALYANRDRLLDIVPPSEKRAVAVNVFLNGLDASGGTATVLSSLDAELQSLHLAPGWDNLTGLGAPKGVLPS